MLTTYEAIELFGLTEAGTDDLPIPDDDALQGRAVREAFEALIGTLQGTGLASEIEPLAYGFATLLQRRAVSLDEAADRLKLKIGALIEAQDGSEVAERELEESQRLFERSWEKALALRLMAETAAECFERETGSAYTPPTGGRTTRRADGDRRGVRGQAAPRPSRPAGGGAPPRHRQPRRRRRRLGLDRPRAHPAPARRRARAPARPRPGPQGLARRRAHRRRLGPFEGRAAGAVPPQLGRLRPRRPVPRRRRDAAGQAPRRHPFRGRAASA